MSPDRNELEVLISLGLTASQAKVYLSLIQKGPSKVALIAQTSKIYREHLYQILKALEQKGLVEKQLDSATIYRAVPLDEALPMLVKNKRQEVSLLESQVDSLVSAYERPPPPNLSAAKPELIVTSNTKRVLNRLEFYFNNATEKIDIVQTWDRFSYFLDRHESTMKKIRPKKIKVRHIVEAPPTENDARKAFSRKIFASENYQIRISTAPSGNYFIVDDKVVCVSAKDDWQSHGESAMLFSNYSGFLRAFRNNFELSWNTAYPVSVEEFSSIIQAYTKNKHNKQNSESSGAT